MIRKRYMLLAAPLCVVVVASAAFASTTGSEHSGDADLDKLHARRPIAASAPFTTALGTSFDPEAIEARLRMEAEAERARALTEQYLASVAAAQAEAAAAAWAAEAEAAALAATTSSYQGAHGDALACIRARESDGAGGYQAVSSGGTYRGAYQFLPSTWNSTAASAGRDDLIGVDPAAASPTDQDALAAHLYSQSGSEPWGGTC